MCWHHQIIGTSRKAELLFKEPINTGFDILVIGALPSTEEQKSITNIYKSHAPLSKFRGGVKDILFYADESAASISDPVYGYTLTPYGMCNVQKAIKDGLSSHGVPDFVRVQSDYNNLIRKNPGNIQTILEDNNHI